METSAATCEVTLYVSESSAIPKRMTLALLFCVAAREIELTNTALDTKSIGKEIYLFSSIVS